MEGIVTKVEYKPKLNFDYWAKSIALGLPKQSTGHVSVTSSLFVKSGYSWQKGQNVAEIMITLVRNCAESSGLVLEDTPHFFFRKVEDVKGGRKYIVTLIAGVE